jgi:uncharacterized phosphosugar-binding protein
MAKDTKEMAHNEGSEFRREDSDGAKSMIDKLAETADWAIDETARIGKAAFERENRTKVVAGAAIGAVASVAVPLVGPIIGALVGAGYVANREDKKSR